MAIAVLAVMWSFRPDAATAASLADFGARFVAFSARLVGVVAFFVVVGAVWSRVVAALVDRWRRRARP